MAERDPGLDGGEIDWEATRKANARAINRRMVDLIAAKTTDMADGPLPLHKSVYTDEERFAAERERLFLSEPLVAGLSGDIPDAGDILLFDAAGPSILAMRGKDGEARAFLNMCTHRGARLVEENEPWSGNAKRLSCPFHAWTFDNRGALIGQPGKAGFAGCDIGARDLIEVPCTEHLGLIFVRADPDGGPIDAKAHLGDFAPILEQLELHRAVPVKKGVLNADSNWKFALDTYGEGYHFKTLHASTIGQTHFNDICVFDPVGRHHRVGFPDLSLGQNVGKDESDWPETDYGGVHFLFPNTVIFFGSLTPGVFFTQLFRLFPDGVGKTRCQFAVYAPFGITDEEYRSTCEMAYDATANVVQTEDYRVASAGYANLLSAPDGYQVVVGANEIALQAVHKHIAETIGMPLPTERS
ncbi:aromatic ring-hydroxylating dioxygenase subunit alpha [Parasphingopyxis algicola]|uniref:aromatic ring-hydroxylating oxygenase subunit alpha n=1 Tax=Parasphingopyxis algicola TaxID=2026624 RepID=UPI0015A480D2|nr:aromatic ring-hydroxylating dioxygenase subunit alpha [Parasphingopyxis algicola]QLC25416.1 aromatic ring-hydroxylating dioxygenase subunit alpha [Parasphingopyxis algicola]